jgi:hypothetical protein
MVAEIAGCISLMNPEKPYHRRTCGEVVARAFWFRK